MQTELFPMKTDYEEIELDKLPEFPGSMPTAQMIKSVKMLGVLEPVILRGTVVVAGRRRINAARKAGLKTIPARIFPSDFSKEEILALVENEHRRPNPLSDLRSVEALMEQGKEEKEIVEETGITPQRLRKILVLQKLIKPLRRAFEDGIIKHGVAFFVAKKPVSTQKKILTKLEQEGCLRLKDAQALCKIERKVAVNKLPDSLFDDVVPDWKPNTIAKLQEVRRIAENDAERDWLNTLDRMIEELK
jgi:ParB/RepB/Spo0J family partition protein